MPYAGDGRESGLGTQRGVMRDRTTHHLHTGSGQTACLGAVRTRLSGAGLRPTRQRLALARLLFSSGDRHVTAETLHEEAIRAHVPVSLATVYNTLHQFTRAGLLREVAVDGCKTYFDTNTSDHHHFFIEDDSTILDIPGQSISVGGLPEAPQGLEIARVEVVVRLRRSR